MIRWLLGWSAGAVLAVALTGPVAAAPKSDLWDRWTVHDPASTQTVDHGVYADLLKALIEPDTDGVAMVRYADLKGPVLERLVGYVGMLEDVPVSTLSRTEQFAYWANLYNALTLLVVAEHYPVKSIRDIDISPGLFADGPWGADLAQVEGQAVTLDDIEHRILRPIFQDPRVHYAVNCASIGCPNLAPEPFTGADLNRQLDAAARAYVNTSRGASIRNGGLTVSRIYDWFQEDFGNTEAGVIAHLKQFAEADLAAALDAVDGIDSYAYDWSLNDGSDETDVLEDPKTQPYEGRRGS